MHTVAKFSLAFVVGLMFHASTLACSCFGPQTFCETIDPAFSGVPDAIVLAVKLGNVEYGADMKVIRSFSGTLQDDQEVRVWGDCGALCRWYVDGFAVGDTVVWGIHQTDLSGNVICGTSFEQPSDFHLSICGIYWLGYENGVVTGPLTTAFASESLPESEFALFVNGCLTTGVDDHDQADPITVRQELDGTTISLNTNENLQITVFDGLGQLCVERTWNGIPIKLNQWPTGIYTVAVLSDKKRWVRKVFVE
ncbi:MAG: T9SS type A sorting domain-containing protein [Flavobacteriales bacterium]|nr:T9SS type A sorting domain-containing protein [Flavobacteriales bacterium]